MSLQLPSAPIEGITSILQNLTTPVHTLVPYARFPVLHAVRVSLVWAGMTAGRQGDLQGRKKVGVLQDLFGYLVVAWGGATISSLLLSRPPPWLFSPIPWIIYPSTYLLFLHPSSPIPLARLITRLIPVAVLEIFGAYIDGITRGSTVALLTSSVTPIPLSPTGHGVENDVDLSPAGAAILSGICISGGGWVVQTLGLNLVEWKLGTPAVLRNGAGILDTLDTWSAMVCSIIYSILIDSPTSLNAQVGDGRSSIISPSVDAFVRNLVPAQVGTHKLGYNGIDTTTARAVVVLLMGSILAARVITRLVLAYRAPNQVLSSAEKAEVKGEIEMQDLSDNVGVGAGAGPRSRAGTPKKRKGAGTPKKSPGPGSM